MSLIFIVINDIIGMVMGSSIVAIIYVGTVMNCNAGNC
jgi:hypothetical protein